MIRFLFKGVIRDKHRSLLPIIVVAAGVMLTVLLHCWISGITSDFIDTNAKFSTGHVKIMSKAYANNEEQLPNDLALTGTDELIDLIKEDYPDMVWTQRIRFGGLIDVPNKDRETKSQGPAVGWAIDMLSGSDFEINNMNIPTALKEGNLPKSKGEILISRDFAERLEIKPGEELTFVGSTMFGGLTFYNFTISGTIDFGVAAMDRGAIIADISDVRGMLDMDHAAGEILGYFNDGYYDAEKATEITKQFNMKYSSEKDEFSPLMLRLYDQNDLGSMLDIFGSITGIILFIFILAMSIVLWNAGLLGGLRRYGEVGVRLAIGENKSHVYRSMIIESLFIGIIGSIIGAAIGLLFSYLLQKYGFNVEKFMNNVTMMIPTTYRAHITPEAYYIGFIPGILSTVIGTMLAGIGIYKRKTAQLFKELEV